jgi:hypothetical protein
MLDSGAKTASINARDIETFERKGSPWMRFRIVSAMGTAWPERPLVRETKIQRHFGKPQRRPVVKLGACVGALPGGPGQPGEPQRFHLPRC